jgi:hypothetical protein
MSLRELVGTLRGLSDRLPWSPGADPSAFAVRPQTLQGPNRSYRKFVVLGHARSGSSLVIGSLRRHPQVVAFGELFVAGRIGFNVEGYDNHSRALRRARRAFPLEFLDQYIFSAYPVGKRAVGFKLFPDQLDKRPFRCVWDWMGRNPDLSVVLLTRRNPLAAYTSLLIARQTGVFGIRDASQRPSAVVEIDVKKCLAEFEKRERLDAISKTRTAGHSVLELTYEELSADLTSHLSRVQAFLGIDVQLPEIVSVKKEVRPLSEVILNHDELRRALSGTKWAHCLEGD